jgi:hypothetical protein
VQRIDERSEAMRKVNQMTDENEVITSAAKQKIENLASASAQLQGQTHVKLGAIGSEQHHTQMVFHALRFQSLF